MDYRELTTEDIEELEEEIAEFYRYRRIFLGVGWGLIGTAFIMLIYLLMYSNNFHNEGTMYLLEYFAFFMIAGGIVMFILRSAMFNSRIKNRKRLIKDAKDYQKKNRLL